MLKVVAQSVAFDIGYWVGVPVLIVVALGLVLWGVRSLGRSGTGAVRVVLGALLVVALALGYTNQIVTEVVVAAPDTSGDPSTRAATPDPTPSPSPTKKPSTPKPVTKKFKPEPLPDPGPAQVYGACNPAINAYNATRFEVIQRARIAWVNGAYSALLAGMRIVVANTRCFEDDMVEGARKVTLKTLNAIQPPYDRIVPDCRQILTDAFRLLGLASGLAFASDGDVDLREGIEVLQKRHPECITEKDVTDMKRALAEELPQTS